MSNIGSSKYDKQEILEIYQNEETIASTAREYCRRNNMEYTDTFRRRVSKIINEYKEQPGFCVTADESIVDNETFTDTNQYGNDKGSVLSAINPDTGEYMDIWGFCEYWGVPKHHVKTYKAVNSQNGGIPTYNIASTDLKGEYFEEFYQQLLEELSKIDNKPQTIKREKQKEEAYLLVVDPADVHIGKLADSFETGEDYNNQIAVQRVKEGVEGIIDKVKGFKIDKILFVGGNDILHTDTPKRTTTSGTFQDTDGMWYSNFLMAKQLYIEVLNRLLQISDIHFVNNPSNHDWVQNTLLADVIKTYYRECKNISFDTTLQHRKYFTYGQNLIGTSHGDGAKTQDLPLLMANESKDWSECKHRYIYTHHVHHKTAKDFAGVTVESLRSPSGADGWHSRNGYQHAPKAIEGFLHHKEFGQIARITHLF